MYKASKNVGAAGSEASDSGKVVPHYKGTTTISLFSNITDLKSKTNIYINSIAITLCSYFAFCGHIVFNERK